MISTFVERDIVNAAGIEKKAAFSKTLKLAAGRVGQLINYSDLAKSVGADLTTVQSWIALLTQNGQNGLIRVVEPYFNNLNQRLLKTPKIYFEDTGLATRLQGWTNLEPLLLSPYLDSLDIHLIDRWVFTLNRSHDFARSRVVAFNEIHQALESLLVNPV